MATPIPSNRAALDARAAAVATGGRVVCLHGTARVARGVTTDSRAVTPSSAFVALRGPRYDGHAFVGQAVAAGAILVVVERGHEGPSGDADVVEVDDTLAAWGAIARAHLGTWRATDAGRRVVAITGSAGKTTTKDMCAAVLGAVGPCLSTTGNLNNRVGVPAVALQVDTHRFAVLEMGMSEPGEIAALAALAAPDVAVVTNVGLAHAGGVGGTVADVAREKGALFEAVGAGKVAVANADDPSVVREARRAHAEARVVTFGTAESADYRLADRSPSGVRGSRVSVRRPSGVVSVFDVPVPGQAAALDFVAALSAAEAAAGGGIDDAAVGQAMRSFAPSAGRMAVCALGEGVVVLDDTYNASPASVRAALNTLQEIGAGRRVVVLGEMRELGAVAAREHEAIGRAVADAGVALLVSCGGLADAAGREAAARGVDVVFAGDAAGAAHAAVDRVRAGDTVLVKASRAVGSERVVEALGHAWGGRQTG